MSRARKVLQAVATFAAGPYLWAKACADCGKAQGRCKRAAENTTEWVQAYEATWEPFNRIFDHLISAFVMSVVYVVSIIVAVGYFVS